MGRFRFLGVVGDLLYSAGVVCAGVGGVAVRHGVVAGVAERRGVVAGVAERRGVVVAGEGDWFVVGCGGGNLEGVDTTGGRGGSPGGFIV